MKLLPTAIALIIAAILVQGGLEARSTLQSKAAAQRDATRDFQRWQSAFSSLEPVQARWRDTYSSAAEVNDLLTLWERIDIRDQGLTADPEKLEFTSIQAIEKDGYKLGISRVCLATRGAGGLRISARSHDALNRGLTEIAKRPDIAMGRVIQGGRGGKPAATVQRFCAYLRGGTPEGMGDGGTSDGASKSAKEGF